MAKIEIYRTVKLAWWFRCLYTPLFIKKNEFIIKYINSEFEPSYDDFNFWLKKAVKYSHD